MSYLDWKVGDKVVCINADGLAEYEEAPVRGQIYTIRDIAADWVGRVGVRLQEVRNGPHPGVVPDDSGCTERGFLTSRFRKVQPRKTDISVFEAILHEHRAPSKEVETT